MNDFENILRALISVYDNVKLISWLFLAVYVVAIFVRSLWWEGATIAILRLLSFRVIFPLTFIIGLNLIGTNVVFVPPTQIGVVLSLISPGGVRSQPLQPGFHFILPLVEEVKLYPAPDPDAYKLIIESILTPQPIPTQQITLSSFTYGVTVLDSAGQPIAHAQVIIEIGGKAPLEDEADSSGYARIEVPASYVERPGRLRVYADGFTSHDQNIDIYPDRLPNTVRLPRP